MFGLWVYTCALLHHRRGMGGGFAVGVTIFKSFESGGYIF